MVNAQKQIKKNVTKCVLNPIMSRVSSILHAMPCHAMHPKFVSMSVMESSWSRQVYTIPYLAVCGKLPLDPD